MSFGDDGAAPAALDAVKEGFEQLLKVVEDRGLEPLDAAGTVRFWREFERLRNRMALVDHQIVRDAQRKDLAGRLCQTSVPRALAAVLLIFGSEANRRVRAADAVAERTSMLGETLDPVRPYLAAAQRDGELSPSRSTSWSGRWRRCPGRALTRSRWGGVSSIWPGRPGTSPRGS